MQLNLNIFFTRKQNKIKNFINFKKYDIKILNPSIALPFRYINKRNQTKFHLSYKKQYVKFSSENISKFANRYNTDYTSKQRNNHVKSLLSIQNVEFEERKARKFPPTNLIDGGTECRKFDPRLSGERRGQLAI